MGHPALEVTEGSIIFKGEDITEADPDERSQAGLFMAFQYPVAIPGVSVAKYLRMIINAQREARGEDQIKIKDFAKTAQEAMELANIPKDFSSRYLNDGFSGGEKKRMELLQLALLKPEIAVLDETDSGLDIDALRVVAEGVNKFAGPDMGVLIITHYQRILHMVKPDFVHVMYEGRIVKEGGPELVGVLEEKGYGWIREEVEAAPAPSLATMEPATADRGAFPIEKVRASFPALEREVNGQPVAYLDSGASSQRVLASIQAVDRYERRHHSNVHRGSHTLSAEATAAYEGARATVADHLGAADRREVVFVRNATEAINLVARAWGDANVGAGDRIVLTEMEHHSNIVPWQQLAERVGAEIDWAPIDDEGLLDMDAFAALLERGPKLVAVAHVSNVLGTENPLAEISRLAARGRRAGARRRRPGGAEDAARRRRARRRLLRAHRPQALRADRDRRALGPARPAAGDAAVPRRRLDDPQGRPARAPPTPTRRPASRRARRRSPRRSGWRRRSAGSTALGMDAVRAHEREIADYALERAGRGPRPAGLRPAPRPRPPRPGLLRARGRPRPRRLRDPRPPRRRRPRRPPLRPAADGPARRRRHRPRQLRRLHDAERDRPPGRRPRRRPPRLRPLSPPLVDHDHLRFRRPCTAAGDLGAFLAATVA